nr:MAG TPA: hypothetical protein [Caudoviricetes sp.]
MSICYKSTLELPLRYNFFITSFKTLFFVYIFYKNP